MARRDDDLIREARERFVRAKGYWSQVAEMFRQDLRFHSGDPTHQWEVTVFNDRQANNIPTLTFDRLGPRIQSIVNKARRERPQPHVIPGDHGDPQIAEIYEDKIRHILYASQADICFDNAVRYAAAASLGAYKLEMVYARQPGRGADPFVQEPRVKWVRDPLSVLFIDPGAKEIDFSDATFWFEREKYRRDAVKAEFGFDPQPWDAEAGEWGDDEDNVWLANYWTVEEESRRYVQFLDGRHGYADEFEGWQEQDIINERDDPQKRVTRYLIDGKQVIETYDWPGSTIPIYIVCGEMIFSEGRLRILSALRYPKDAQSFLNGAVSELAVAFATANQNGWTGYVGSFKDKKWASNKRELYREFSIARDPDSGQILPPPTRDAWAPPIQHLVQGVSVASDAIQAGMGYQDMLLRPSQHDLSGVAIQNREQQTDTANSHYEDNLIASHWRLGRDLVELIRKTTDTPRMMALRGQDGSHRTVPVSIGGQLVPGHENEPHYRIDEGDYDVAIDSRKSYATLQEEEADILTNMWEANPMLVVQLFGDLFFKKLGYNDLADRAIHGLSPQIQQAVQGQNGQQNVPPQVQAQIAALSTRAQQLQQALGQAIQMIQSKAVEGKAKLDIEKLKAIKDVMVESMKQRHDSTGHMLDAHLGAIEHITGLLHESQMATQQQAAQQQPQPGGVQ